MEKFYQDTHFPIIYLMRKEDVIKYQMTRYFYNTNEEAFQDFLFINNAVEIEIDE